MHIPANYSYLDYNNDLVVVLESPDTLTADFLFDGFYVWLKYNKGKSATWKMNSEYYRRIALTKDQNGVYLFDIFSGNLLGYSVFIDKDLGDVIKLCGL